ncbi:MAG: NAD(P)-binding domain-containing protein, partial [Desulfovibrionaceae bacterium]|nr:NAD(P)-binding domain-containing protein [Desulfovibrionaceae bacterium]
MNSYSIAVAGGGSWGTALANLLVSEGHKAILWLRDESKAKEINLKHENTRYLPGLKLHPELSATSDPQVLGAEILVLAIPLQNLRSWLGQYASFLAPNPILCNAAKGLEIATQLTAQGIINECLALRGKTAHYAVISGPSFAVEVIQQLPTAVVLATDEPKLGLELRSIFSGSFFRCYSSSDVIGVE